MKTILIVDDMAIFRQPIAISLRQHGYHTMTASDGREALAKARKAPPDLILLDIAMPGMDGLEFLERRMDDPLLASIPVILLSALTEQSGMVRAAKLGVRDYLLKSQFSIEELLARVHKRLSASAGAPATAHHAAAATAATAATKTMVGKASVQSSPAGPAIAVATPDSPVRRVATGAPPATPSRANSLDVPAPVLPVPGALEALKSIRSIVSRTEIEEQIGKIGEVRALSASASQLLKLTSSSSTSMEDVIRVVRQDQAIALKILKLANSVVYTRGAPVESVHKAVMRIGLAQIRQAVMNISVIEQFHVNGMGEHLSNQQFWEHSIGCGLIAAEITHATGGTPEDADRAFTMGLLHDVGRMVYAEHMGEVYRSVLNTANRLQLPLEQVESRMMLINHADLMDRVLTLWRFPKDLITPIALHHLSIGNIRHLAPTRVEQIATLALANGLAHALLLGSSGNLAAYPTHQLASTLRVGADVVRRIVEQIPDQTQDIKLAMLASSDLQHWQPMDEQLRQKIGVALNPITVSMHTGVDGFMILAERLRRPAPPGEPTEAGPNIAIVHIAQASEREAVTSQLRAAEAAAPTRPLPTIVFSPAGNLGLETSAMAGRRVELLAYPLALSRLVTALRAVLGVT